MKVFDISGPTLGFHYVYWVIFVFLYPTYFFSLPCDRVIVLKIIWLIILKTLSLLMWLNTYIYIFLSTLFFLEMCKGLIYLGQGGSSRGPMGQEWGKVVCHVPQGRVGTEKGDNHAGQRQRSHPPASPRPALPHYHPY